MQVDLVQGRVDVRGLVADDVELDVGRQLRAAGASNFAFTPSMTATVFSPGLPAHLRMMTVGAPLRRAAEPLLLGAVLGVADVPHAHAHAVEGGHHEVVEALADRRSAPSCAARPR